MSATYLPAAIRAIVGDADAVPIHVGESAASVTRLRARDRELFLKICPSAEGDGLAGEAARLRWLAGRLPVPEVVSFVAEGDVEFLLMTSIHGVNGVDAGREHAQGVVIGLAHALKILHAVPTDECPFDQTVTTQIERARQRVASGLVDEADFDEERIGRTARDVLTEAEASLPGNEARTLTHGDACLPNVMFEGGKFAGFIDCGRAGVADPYQDLALAARSIAFNLGQEHVAAFFEHYGVPKPDQRKLAFYRLLDEFF